MTSTSAFIPLDQLRSAGVPAPQPNSIMRVAIVCMPWGSVQKPSLAMGILKQLILAAGHIPELHHLNFNLAAQIGLDAYEEIASGAFFHQEWFFSQHLFGGENIGELENRWDQMLAHKGAEAMLRAIAGSSREREDYFRSLAERQIPHFLDTAFTGIEWQRYSIVGFTTTFAQSLASLALAKRIKAAHPHISIVFGGANVDAEMGNEFVRAFPWIDHAVHGEAEYTFPQLLQAIARKEEAIRIPGISSRVHGKVFNGHLEHGAPVNINDSPPPDYTDYLAAIEANGFKGAFKLQLFYESSRGCWWGEKHHCTFCGLNGQTMKFRQKDPETILSEILKLSREYSCLSLAATDNILSNQSWATFLPRLAGEDLDIALFYEVKANLSFEQLRILRSAGVREIQPGIESFSTRVLKLMNKGVTAIQNIQLLKWCYELGIRPVWNILYGFPGECDEDYASMEHLIRSISHLCPPGDTPRVMFERFSPYHFDSETYGLILRPASEYQYIFPKAMVSFERIAYFFEDSDAENGDRADARFRATSEEVARWRSSWEHQNCYLFYEKGPGFLHVYDNRPRDTESVGEARLIKLGGELAKVYQFCHTIRSRRAILEKFGNGEDELTPRNQALGRVLDALVRQKLLHMEGERYLALAVHKTSRRFWPDKY